MPAERRPPGERTVLVRGGGVVGLVTAVTLAERGWQVGLAEAGARTGSGASWLAGGMLAPWCEAETAPRDLLDHAEATIGWWQAHVPSTVREGSLVLAPGRDAGELAQFGRRTEGHVRLDREAVGQLEPDLAGRFESGLFFAREAHLDPRLALPGLAATLRAHGGELLLERAEVPDGFAHVVDCRGFGARAQTPGLRGVRGEMLLLRCREIALARPVRLLHPRTPVYVVPRGEGVFMLGATMVESERQGPITARAAMELLGAAYALHPAFAEAEILETGAGLRPAFDDNMPRVWEGADGVIGANGMYRHGFLLAPVLAAEVAERLAARLQAA